MTQYSLSHVSDSVLLVDLSKLVARDRATSARLLAHIAEVDARKLYRPAAYPSMFEYCVRELHMSEGTAFKRIRAARAARRFPAIFDAVGDGRLHLSAVVLIARHLTAESADELVRAVAHRSKSDVEQMLADRFPSPDLATRMRALPIRHPKVSPGTVEPGEISIDLDAPILSMIASETSKIDATRSSACAGQSAASAGPAQATNGECGAMSPCSAARGPTPSRPEFSGRVAPLAPQRYAIQMTVDRSIHEKLQYARQLLGHQVPSADLVMVFGRALDALVRELEKQKFGRGPSLMPSSQRIATSTRYEAGSLFGVG